MAQYNFDFGSAIKAGYTPDQINQYIAQQSQNGDTYQLTDTPQATPEQSQVSAQPPVVSQVGASYIHQKAQELGLDPNAVLGVANNEGMNGGVGDNGTSFGPFQLHAGGALPDEIWQKGPQFAKQWAWSQDGVDYALNTIAKSGARGLRGRGAVNAIVNNFERPSDPTGDLNSGYRAVGG